ncbi:MAG: hypothetical protein ACR2HH_02895 [Chthoniobacterales bacterium]
MVLALGVIGFSLVAILGVFPIGLAANRSSITDTRAAQIANEVTATIDAQCASFSNIDCYGATLDLATLKIGDVQNLYVSYPSPAAPAISATQTPDSTYTVELQFDNDPPLTDPSLPSGGTKLGVGKLNRIQLRIFGRNRSEGTLELFFLARNKA